MTLSAAFLVLLSAVLHSAWNFASKKEGESVSVALFAWANAFAVVFLLPVAFFSWSILRSLPPSVAWLLVLTGFFELLYFAGLAPAYRGGDLSLVYPLARSLPVLLVAVVAAFIPTQERLTPLSVCGMLLVVAGCFLLPLARISEWHPTRYLHATSAFALLAACGTAGYSTVDSEGLRLLREGFPAAGKSELALAYLFGEAVTSAAWLALYAVLKDWKELARSWKQQKRAAAFIGAASYVTYGLVLMAMHFATNVSYVVALRQTSIVLSVALGVLVLGEPAPGPKMVGGGLVTAGLILVALG